MAIYAKTRMKTIPKTCKDCALSFIDYSGVRVCPILKKECPWEPKPSGNIGYGKPTGCPLSSSTRLLT